MTDFKIAVFTGMLFLCCSSPLLAGQKGDEEPASESTAEPEQAQKMDGADIKRKPRFSGTV